MTLRFRASIFVICVIFCVHLKRANCQRLSQGASDWYMRFHSNFKHVKRDVHPPVTKSFIVTSNIKHRYAITEVKTVIENPATINQNFSFGFVMAKSALVSNVTLLGSNGDIIKSVADASDWANCFMTKLDDDNSTSFANGNDNNNDIFSSHANGNENENGTMTAHPNGHNSVVDSCEMSGKNRDDEHLSYLHHREDFKQFVLPITIDSKSNVTLRFVYEYLLERTDNSYRHTLSISPGELVHDFRIRLNIVENRPLKNLKLNIPALGDNNNALQGQVKDTNEFQYDTNMTFLQQSAYFGQHGYTGDFKVSYDLKAGRSSFDLVTEDEFFVHFYDVPEKTTMKSIPKHVIFLLDSSESMSGKKLDLAKSSVKSLIDSLDASHTMSLLVFDSEVEEFNYNFTSNASSNTSIETGENLLAFPCTNDTFDEVNEYLKIVNITDGAIANITNAIDRAIKLDKEIWDTEQVPENALSMIIVVTDGHSAFGDKAEIIGKQIRLLNKVAKIPIFSLGIGNDANMEFLEDMAEASCGRTCIANVLDDYEDVELELKNVERHLNDMVLKNLDFHYIGDVFDEGSLTRTTFKAFHQGGSVAVAGQFNIDETYPQFQVELSGQSANGPYLEVPEATPFVTNGCKGEAKLCSAPKFRGDCVSILSSMPSLRDIDFDNKAVSVNITGDCAWIACDKLNFSGPSLTLIPGRVYGGLPGELHRSISSLRMVALEQVTRRNSKAIKESKRSKKTRTKEQHKNISENSVARLWAFVNIRDILERAAENDITKIELEKAYSLAMKYHFLTPFTILNFVQSDASLTVSDYIRESEPNGKVQSLVSQADLKYGDLSPIFYNGGMIKKWEQLQKCEQPIVCEGNYHIEKYINAKDNGSDAFHDVVNCTGSITLYTKSNYQGEALRIEGESIYQLYHRTNGYRIRSIKTEGECCWNLFDERLFNARKVERICGDKNIAHRRKNIGSIKRNQPNI